ncbi:MAG: glycosyltransferase family 2 protein [Planctomycetaceae bacterium]
MTAASIWIAVFWISAIAVIWPHLIYPLTLTILRSRPHRTGARLPSVSLIISAFNEEPVIGEKIENALELDYPSERLDIIVVSDFSTDGTDGIVTSFAERGVRLLRMESRLGKSVGVTRAVQVATGEIVVFSDANSMYAPGALRHLVRHFADPTVGYVVGHQRYLTEAGGAADSETLYWSFETWLKRQESRIGSVVGGDGAIYAIRSDQFEPLREDDISDFTLPLRIVVRGYRGIFDPLAVCTERPAGGFESEFRRKVRIVTRSCRAILRVPQALNPLRVGVFAYELASHKLLRWFAPVFLIALATSTAMLAATREPVYVAAALFQAGLYLAALAGALPGLSRLRVFYIPLYFVLMNAAAAAGILGVVFGYRFSVWTPERREVTSVRFHGPDQTSGIET